MINLKVSFSKLFCIIYFVFCSNCGIVLSDQRCWDGQGYAVPDGGILIRYGGNPLDIMCILDPNDTKITVGLNASFFSFKKNEDLVLPELIEAVNSTAIKLHIDNPTLTVADVYRCLWNGSSVCVTKVIVGTPPPQDVDFECISLNLDNLTCSWPASKFKFNDSYNLSFWLGRFGPRMRNQYFYESPPLEEKDNRVTCFWDYDTIPYYDTREPFYLFRLLIRNSFGTSIITKTLNHFSRVVPGPPEELKVVDTTPSSMKLSWVLPKSMQNFTPGLYHRILYQCEFCGKGVHFGGLVTTKTDQNVTFLLSNLEYPNTLYEIKVASRSAVAAAPHDEAMWSQSTSVAVRTSKLLTPPKIASFEIAIHPQYREAYIYWRHILNGPHFRYNIIIEGHPEIQATEITTTYAKFKYLLPSSSYTFRVWSGNTVEMSSNTSSISIPAEKNRVREPLSFTKIELGDGQYELMWEPLELPHGEYVTNYTIFWCNSEMERPHPCDGLLDWEDVSNVTFKSVSLEKHKKFQFAIAVNTNNGTSGMLWEECTVVPDRSTGKIRNVWIKKIGSDFLEVAWKLECFNRVGKIDGYIVNYCPVSSTHQSDCTDFWKSTIFYGGSSVQSGIITNLKPATTYMVTLSVLIKDKEFGPQSDIFYGTTRNCKPTVTRYNNRQTCARNLIFNEAFTNLSSLWSREIKFAGGPDYEFVLYGSKPENFQVQNGLLQIRPVPSDELFGEGYVSKEQVDLGTQCTGILGTPDCVQKPVAFLILPPVKSAQITTKTSFSFKFGKVEIRAKLPKGDWIYPELYLNSVNDDYGPGYASGQIRIAFLPGNKDSSKNLQMGGVLGSSKAARNYAMKNIKKNKVSWSDTFHRFTVIWRPDRITVKVDGHSYGNIFAPRGGFISKSQHLELENVDRWRDGTLFAPFDQEMYLSIGVGVGGHCFDDRTDGTKPWVNNDPKSQRNFYKASSQWRPSWTNASALEIDYIKIWAL